MLPKAAIRIIPRLDIKGPNLVKGIHFEGLRVLGKPWDFALNYYESGADELLYIDIVASLYGRNNLLDIVSKTAENIFIPLTVGGGIRTIEDIRMLLRAGADKVAINTAALKNPTLIRDAATIFGSQCIVISIEAKKMPNGTYEALMDNGREQSGKEVLAWAKQATELGAGEILLTSIDQEGTGRGYDLHLIEMVSKQVSTPLIAGGGAGNVNHILEVLRLGTIQAISVASLFHYSNLKKILNSQEYQYEGNIEFLKRAQQGTSFMKERLEPVTIGSLKDFLGNNHFLLRT